MPSIESRGERSAGLAKLCGLQVLRLRWSQGFALRQPTALVAVLVLRRRTAVLSARAGPGKPEKLLERNDSQRLSTLNRFLLEMPVVRDEDVCWVGEIVELL